MKENQLTLEAYEPVIMDNWSKAQQGSVTLNHLSTTSLVRIDLQSFEPEETGGEKMVIRTMHFDYTEFEDLIKAINIVQYK